MISQKQFNKTIESFNDLEKRGGFYSMSLKLIKKGFKTEALLLILATWNFASFRYAMKTFDVNEFDKLVKKINKDLQVFKNKSFLKIDFKDFKPKLTTAFEALHKVKGIHSTGASKLMHLLFPKVFVMWDGYIRKYYGFKKGDVEDYFNFLQKMQKEFGHLRAKGKSLAKAIDEYNYVTITLAKLQEKHKES